MDKALQHNLDTALQRTSNHFRGVTKLVGSGSRSGLYELVWSYMLDYENEKTPFRERREQIAKWRKYARVDVDADDAIIQQVNALNHLGLKQFDALHVACAVAAGADYFLTTDKGILKKYEFIKDVQIKDPIDFIREVSE